MYDHVYVKFDAEYRELIFGLLCIPEYLPSGELQHNEISAFAS